MSRIQYIIVHWSVTPPKTTVDDIRQMHKNRGYRDIGYHRLIIHPDATIYREELTKPSDLIKRGRSLNNDNFITEDEVAAAAIGFNRNAINVCVVGSPKYPPHPLQLQALKQTLDTFIKRHGLKPSNVFGHRDKNPTQCPGDIIYKFIQDYKRGKP